MTNGNDITDLDSRESWGDVSGHVSMSFLESVILLDVMEVISSQDNSSGHFVGEYDTFKDSASNADGRSERTFLINVLASLSFLRGLVRIILVQSLQSVPALD